MYCRVMYMQCLYVCLFVSVICIACSRCLWTCGCSGNPVCNISALQVAMELAEQISSFPQQCLRADRASAYYTAFDAASFTEAMQHETDHGLPVIRAESVTGATRFSSGVGRGGKFSWMLHRCIMGNLQNSLKSFMNVQNSGYVLAYNLSTLILNW